MNKQVSSLTNEQPVTQEVFWTRINESVRQTVVDLAQKAMELIRDSRLEAGWNQRNAGRRLLFSSQFKIADRNVAEFPIKP